MISSIHVLYVGKQISAMADFSLEYRGKKKSLIFIYMSTVGKRDGDIRLIQ